MPEVLRLVNTVLVVYLLVISLRILMSWFGNTLPGGSMDLLKKVTDPYLGFFRRFGFLQMGAFEFSPVAGVLLLVIAIDLANSLAQYTTITLGLVLAIALRASWSAASFILLILFLMVVARTILPWLGAAASARIQETLDAAVTPLVRTVSSRISLGENASFTNYLVLTMAAIAGVWLAGRVVSGWLITVFASSPF